jgi:hypothetical protein
MRRHKRKDASGERRGENELLLPNRLETGTLGSPKRFVSSAKLYDAPDHFVL